MSDLTNAAQPKISSVQEGAGAHSAPDLVVYAMQLVTEGQAKEIEKHLAQCSDCREELGRINGDLTLAALAAEAAAPPSSGRDRLLAQVAKERKVVPPQRVAVPIQPAAPKDSPRQDSAPVLRPLADFGRGKGTTLAPEPVDVPPSRTTFLPWAGWAVAAILAAALGFLYAERHAVQDNLTARNSQIERLNTNAAQSHQLMDALTDPRAVRVTLAPKAPSHQPMGEVTYNPTKGTLVFLASNLDPLQTYKTYELWVIPAGKEGPIPAGTFHPDSHGNASVIMPNLPKDVQAKAFGVTIEDAGGADKPTLPIILSGS